METEPVWDIDPFAADGDSFIPPPSSCPDSPVESVYCSPALAFSTPSVASTVSRRPTRPRQEIALVSLHTGPKLVSLARARHTPEIVYHSVQSPPAPTSELDTYRMKLISLVIAAGF